MLASVEQDFELTKPGEGLNALVNEPRPGEKTHTYLNLATELAYSYKRDTVTIYGNVVNATHGETRNEIARTRRRHAATADVRPSSSRR